MAVPLRAFGLRLDAPEPGPAPAPEALRADLDEHRVLVLRGFAPFPSKEALAAYAARWGPLLEWDFGAVFEVVEHEHPKNYLFSSGSVPYHWDGAFAPRTPWLQVFQCQESPGAGQGGETLFCDTTRVWRSAPEERRARWTRSEIEYATEKVAHYGGTIRARLVGAHPRSGATTLRFAEPANAATAPLNTPDLRVLGVPDAEAAELLDDLRTRIYAPENVYAHEWRTGDLVIADNHALLHGRSPYLSKRPRRLWRVHVL